MTLPFLFASGWKMTLTTSDVDAYLERFVRLAVPAADREVIFLPSFTAIETTRRRLEGTAFAWGAQDVHPEDGGAHTGDVSGRMLADLGCSYVMVGHAERRRDHGETDALVAEKIAAARRWGITPLLCVGDAERGPVDAALATVARQLDALDACEDTTVVAYEPVWAIGSGVAADLDRVASVHAGIRRWLGVHRPAFARRGRIAYGGSVSETSGASIVRHPDVDGLFVGSASGDPRRFAAITGLPLT